MENTEITEKKAYTLRHLTAADTFPMMKILRKVGVKEFKECFSADDVKELIREAKEKGAAVDTGRVGMTVALNAAQYLMERLPDCEKEIFAFLAGLSGMKPDEIAALPLGVFADMLVDVFKDEEFSDFFTAASRLFK